VVDYTNIKIKLIESRGQLGKNQRNDQLSRETHSDLLDLAEDSINKELSTMFESHDQTLLKEIDLALIKIARGTYGICEACKETIPIPRLEFIPMARLCIGCQENRERRGIRPSRSRNIKSDNEFLQNLE
jgi:DnaK suppressor protein|tara:strand:+ start:370 stop:759 length:390 start_codon:yes stop_codon:yes gene_type:complete